MFAYLLIAFELAILYLVFWHVFIREPKPYRVRGNLWGSYEGAGQSFTPCDIECCANESPIGNYELFHSMTGQAYARKASRHLCAPNRQTTMRYGWVVAEQRTAGSVFSRMIDSLKRSLEVLCVKLP